MNEGWNAGMIEKNRNPAAEALRADKKLSCAWVQAASPVTAEILAEAGFDVLLVDMEHGPGDIMVLMAQIQAMKGEKAVPFVRAPWNDFVIVKRILDAGAYGLIIPYVSTKAEAQAAVRAAKYPPDGIRGIAGSTRAAHYGNNSLEYFDTANRDIFVFVQVETPEAVKNIDDILSVPGVDGIFIGPMDLATTHGYRGKPGTPQMQEIIKGLEAKIKARGKALATICADFSDAKAKYDRGYNMITLISDTVNLGRLAREEVEKFRKEVLGA
jgi:2-dehydro-3-deoxyglucarate aldolase/4-hydroxy-2-oxoheptanedioate aldolase